MQLDEAGNHLPARPLSLHFGVKDDGQKGAFSNQQEACNQILHISDHHQVVCNLAKQEETEMFSGYNLRSIIRAKDGNSSKQANIMQKHRLCHIT